uniref:VWFD domain-containing protein n=1 Tax=Ciona intestinalis TaxID=7719 RepID=H2Y2J7_CIOIN
MRHYTQCIDDMCASQGSNTTLTEAIESYARECLSQGVQVCNWRQAIPSRSSNFTMCASNSHYNDCASGCPDSCGVVPFPERCPMIESCECDEGYILQGTQCVSLTQCNCYVNDNIVEYGTSYLTSNCKAECTCYGNNKTTCNPVTGCATMYNCVEENGLQSCVKTLQPRVSCTSIGGLHYTTFDGSAFRALSTCTYTMVRSLDGASGIPSFYVAVTYQSVTSYNSAVKEIRIVYENTTVVMARHGVMVSMNETLFQINGIYVIPGTQYNGVNVTQVGGDAVVVLPFKLVVRWNGLGFLQIDAWRPLMGKIEGLCGDFDDNPNNDFVPRPDTSNTAASVLQHWELTNQTGCSIATPPAPPCEGNSLTIARSRCDVLLDGTGPFSQCHDLLEPRHAYQTCVYQSCTSGHDPAAEMRVISSYGNQCRNRGGVPGTLDTTLPCPMNSTYQACGMQCQALCTDRDASFCSSISLLGRQCVSEGCQCDAGLVYENGSCVSSDSCGCLAPWGAYITAGSSLVDAACGIECNCVSGVMTCRNTSCYMDQYCGARNGVHGCHWKYPCTILICKSALYERDGAVCICNYSKKQCKVSGDPHYTTFDGKRYDFQGTCIYQTVKTTFNSTRGRLEPFSILVENELRSKSFRKVSWFRRAFIDIKGTLIVFRKRRKISVDGILVNVPIQIEVDSANIVNINQRGSLVVLTTSFGLTITYDGNARFIITLSGSYANLVTGLCGNINGNENDDLRLASNHSILANPNKFGNSYKVGGWSAGCQDGDPNDADGNCIEANNYRNLCNVVDGSCFTECRAGIKTPDTFKDCVFDMCVTSGDLQALEEAVADYADSCQENGFKICDWRKITKTPKNCQPNAHYEHEGTACPNSCIFPNRAKRCSRPKISGCVCDSGYVLSGQDCVRLSQCGCTSAGRYYKDGDTFLNTDCTERCTCRNTKLTCKATSCVAGAEKCGISPTTLEKTCMPITTATCRATGDPHYRSFDNKKFDFQGSCTYTMYKQCFCPLPKLHGFSYLVVNRTKKYQVIKYTYKLVFYVYFLCMSICNRWANDVKVDGEQEILPIVLSGFRIDIRGRFVTMTTTSGAVIKFDGETSFIIGLPTTYSGHVQGLCGNMNNDASDEFLDSRRKSLVPVVMNPLYHVFYLHRCNTPPVQHDECSRPSNAANMLACSLLTATEGCFSQCHSVISPDPFYQSCITALCRSTVYQRTTLKIQIGSYADACQLESAEICNWRDRIGAAMECLPNSRYVACGMSEPQTCANLNSPPLATTSCVEGCQCDEGYLLSGEQCVHQSTCGCFIQRKYRLPGFTFRTSDCAHECTCVGVNQTSCVLAPPCGVNEHCGVRPDGFSHCFERTLLPATCHALGDPHYQTFDGAAFDSMSTCAHIMANKSRADSTITPFTVIAINDQPRINQTVSHTRITLKEGPVIMVNGAIAYPGASFDGFTIRKLGVFVILSFNFGLVVRWDGVDRLRISAWSPLSRHVEGLCGNFDGDPTNDFAAANGGGLITDVDQFVNSWMVTGPDINGCRLRRVGDVAPPCSDNNRLLSHMRDCAILTSTTGPFAPCHGIINPRQDFKNCVFDLCAYGGNQSYMERILSSYDYDCRERNVTVTGWREVLDLPFQCSGNMVFSSCMSQCQATCSDPDRSICESNLDLGTHCIEGCQCPNGFVQSSNNSGCVPQELCGCVVNGRYQLRGFIYRQNNCSEECVCMGNNVVQCN